MLEKLSFLPIFKTQNKKKLGKKKLNQSWNSIYINLIYWLKRLLL